MRNSGHFVKGGDELSLFHDPHTFACDWLAVYVARGRARNSLNIAEQTPLWLVITLITLYTH